MAEHLNDLFARVPQRCPFPSMVKKSVTSLKTKPKHRLRLFLDGFYFAHGEEFGYFDQTNGGARILPLGESRVVLNSLVPAR